MPKAKVKTVALVQRSNSLGKITCQVYSLNLKENGKEVARFFAEAEKVIFET
jgi:hypothetical protein